MAIAPRLGVFLEVCVFFNLWSWRLRLRAFWFTSLALMALTAMANATIYTGSLSYSPPPDSNDDLLVFGNIKGWPTYSLTISWTVTDTDVSQPGYAWKYTYEIEHSSNKFGYSHVIIETSPTASCSDFTGFLNAGIESYGLQGPSSGNPNMPEDLYGIKLTPYEGGLTDWTFSFYSNRAPIWGDVYVRDGGNPVNSAYNRGFTSSDTDPAYGAWEGTLDNHYFYHILRPDTVSLIPEPMSVVLFVTGLFALGGYRRLRKQR